MKNRGRDELHDRRGLVKECGRKGDVMGQSKKRATETKPKKPVAPKDLQELERVRAAHKFGVHIIAAVFRMSDSKKVSEKKFALAVLRSAQAVAEFERFQAMIRRIM
jgi:hypothetical protein